MKTIRLFFKFGVVCLGILLFSCTSQPNVDSSKKIRGNTENSFLDPAEFSLCDEDFTNIGVIHNEVLEYAIPKIANVLIQSSDLEFSDEQIKQMAFTYIEGYMDSIGQTSPWNFYDSSMNEGYTLAYFADAQFIISDFIQLMIDESSLSNQWLMGVYETIDNSNINTDNEFIAKTTLSLAYHSYTLWNSLFEELPIFNNIEFDSVDPRAEQVMRADAESAAEAAIVAEILVAASGGTLTVEALLSVAVSAGVGSIIEGVKIIIATIRAERAAGD